MQTDQQQALKEAEETYYNLFNNSADLIYIHDENGLFIDVNKAVVEKYGYPKDEVIGKTPAMFAAPGKNDIPAVFKIINQVWEKDTVERFEWWSITNDGEEFLKEILIRKGRYHSKDVLIATGRDITARRFSQDKLKRQNQKLKQLNSALDAFVYSASHDLKAPLSSMKGLLDLMVKDDPSNMEEYVEQMLGSVDMLSRYVNDLVDYSRNAKTGVAIESIKINDKVKQIVNELKYAEEAESIVFDLQLNARNEIYSDLFRIRTILSNLISNAIRYHDDTKKNKYIIVKTDTTKNSIRLSVIDNGIGIASEHQKDIFKMFYRTQEKNISGSGIGLFMVKEAVDLLEGKLEIESSKGNGTKMLVTIPVSL